MLVDGLSIYPNRPDLKFHMYWLCKPCAAYVGCHKKGAFIPGVGVSDGTVPLGRLANVHLRYWKRRVHDVLDPLWQSGRMHRGELYKALARHLGIKTKDCHVGMFDESTCRRAIKYLSELHHA